MCIKLWKLQFGVLSIILLLTWTQAQTETTVADQSADEVEISVAITAYTLSFTLSDEDNYSFVNITCRNGDQEIIANEQHVCENLYPCTVYTSTVTLMSNGTELSPKTKQATTDYIEPITNITTIVATSNSITLTWQATDHTCVNYFEISAKSPDNSVTTPQLSDKNTYTFPDLQPCQQHNITLRTFNNENVIVDNDTAVVDTEYNEPGELTLTVNNLSNGDTWITWNDAEHKTCIDNYTLAWQRNLCEEAQCQWEKFSDDATLKQYTLTDLQGCDSHTFMIYINDNRTSKASTDFIAAEKLPGAVQQVVANANHSVLSLVWDAPKANKQCVANYWVNISGPTQRPNGQTYEEQIVNDSHVEFVNLSPCGTYKVEIVPISLNGTPGTNYQTESTLSEDNPSEILEPQTILGPFSIEISWQTPNYAELCIDEYRITGWMDDDTPVAALNRDTKDNNVVFKTDLSCCQVYIIQIIAKTFGSMDGNPRQIELETEPALVDASKIDFQIVKIGSHNVELNARNQDNNNNCQTIFAHFNCSTTANVPYTYAEKYTESHTQSFGFQATLTPLSPSTAYFCEVLLYNVAGASKKALALKATEDYFPEPPKDLRLDNSSLNSLSFRWEAPDYPNGQIRLYHEYFVRYEADYFVPDFCAEVEDKITSQLTNNQDESFSSLLPATKYSLQVAAENDYGIGQYTAPMVSITQSDVSKPVTELRVDINGPYPDESNYSATANITWHMPCQSNGKIETFLLEFSGSRARSRSEIAYFNRTVKPNYANKGRMSHAESELLPEFEYNVNVAVKTEGVDKLSETEQLNFEAPAGIPARLSEDLVGGMRVNAYETSHPTKSAVVRLPSDILDSNAGTIKYIALLLSQKDCAHLELQFDAMDTKFKWPDVASWQEAGGNGSTECIEQYQTTPMQWVPVTSNGPSGKDEITFIIGEESCPNIAQRYCNGPLQADTEYNLVVRLFTNSGYNDAALLEFKTEAAIKVTLILVSVCCCLMLAFVLGLVVLWVRKRIEWHRDSGQGIEDPFGNVIAKNFAIFYSEVAKPEKLAREFKEITVVALELSYAASELGCTKNRYADIYPYDKNRVMLDDADGAGSDYINASFIDGHTHKKEYIATQGPKPETVMDFWRMILQYNVRVIVQVTQFREGNAIKCHEYFPCSVRGLSVTVKSKESLELYDRTELSVVHDVYGLKQRVIHYFFKKWPDHGCPEDPMHLITLVRKVKAERRPNYSPIVVHCSAGVGRTGTFIAVDLIMQRLKSESKINIFETVKKLRFQRMKMVQTQQQYSFLYACTYELVKHKLPRAVTKYDACGKPSSNSKKVSFPDTNEATSDGMAETTVSSAPDANLGNGPTATLTLSSRLRKSRDLHSLYEQPERSCNDSGEALSDL